MMLMFMIMLIWDDIDVYDIVTWNDVDVYDNVDFDDDVDNVIEMKWCWWWYWDDMMLMLIITLRWDDVDVDDVIVIMYVVYVHGGCSDHVGYPWWGK